jgi:signal transduction histidine kinase
VTGALRNETLLRWLPVIVLPPILLLDGVLSSDGQQVDALSVLFAYIAVLPLLFRERLGFFGMAPLLVGSVILVLWNFEPGTTVVAIPAWALYEFVRQQGRREAIVGSLIVVPCVFVSVLPFASSGQELASVTLRNVALCELAIAVGYLMWHNRAALEREVAAREADAERRLTDERVRIAREVHDVVAHAMVAINVQAGVAAHLLDEGTDQARDALQHIKRTSGDALADLRATLGLLREPGNAAPTGPAAGLDELDVVADQLRAAGVEVAVDVDTVGSVPAPVQSASYRIVQEALTNVLRHANAKVVSVVVRGDDHALTIAISDDGTRPAEPSTGAGAGVRGMRERAEALGGSLEAGARPEGGWRVEATLPLRRARSHS